MDAVTLAIILACGAAVAGVPLIVRTLMPRGWYEEDLPVVAQTLGGRITSAGPLRAVVAGDGRGVDWILTVLVDGNDGGNLSARLTVRGDLPRDVAIGPEGFFTGSDPDVGDRRFDAVIHLQGKPARLSALLDHDARQALLAIQATGSGGLKDGVLSARRGLDFGELPALGDWVAGIVALAESLARPTDPVERLLRVAADDPSLETRYLARQRLLLSSPEDPRAQAQARAVLADGGPPGLLLEAAMILGDVELLTRLVANPVEPAERRLAALQAALDAGAERGPWLSDALVAAAPEVQGAAFEAAGRLGATDLLLRAGTLAVVPRAGAEAALARALIHAGPPAEGVLLRMLRAPGDEAAAAATSLGAVGTRAAVEPLLDVVARSGLRRTLVRAARDAVTRIQERLEGAGAGGLSVVEGGAGGELALAHEGGLSLEDPARAAARRTRQEG